MTSSYPRQPLPYPPYEAPDHPYFTFRAADFHHAHVEAHYRSLLTDCEAAFNNKTPVYVRGKPGIVVDIIDRYIGDCGTYVDVAMEDGSVVKCRTRHGGVNFAMPFVRIAP